MSKKKNKKKTSKKTSQRELIERLLLMTQNMANALNIETAGVLHNTGWCNELIAKDENGKTQCPICIMEEMKKESKTNDNERPSR